MDIIMLLGIAVGLCFDSFAVSVSGGLSSCGVRWRLGFRFAAILGVCQGLFPFLGWVVGRAVYKIDFVGHFDHWIAFVLLTLVGAKMIVDSLAGHDDSGVPCSMFSLRKSMILGIATSIDALITGFALAMVHITVIDASPMANILISVLIIGIITFVASVSGLYIGRHAGKRLDIGSKATIVGGIILIIIGLKILVEHLLNH